MLGSGMKREEKSKDIRGGGRSPELDSFGRMLYDVYILIYHWRHLSWHMKQNTR